MYPILEFDEDKADKAKEYYFSNGKKDFSGLQKAREMGIDKCVLFLPRHFDDLTKFFPKCVKIYEFKAASTVSPVYLYDNKCLIALCPLGGPAVAGLIEELHFNGITKYVSCGTCGLIDKNLKIEHFFVPTSAIRDEGLSYHYVKASRELKFDKQVVKTIEYVLKSNSLLYYKGKTWTIDAIYRETPTRIARRLKEGAIGVEMECASIAAVCKYYNCKFGALLYFSDLIGTDDWQWRIYDRVEVRTKLIDVCLKTLDIL